MQPKNVTGPLLKRVRRTARFSQKMMAFLLGVHVNTVQRIEKSDKPKREYISAYLCAARLEAVILTADGEIEKIYIGEAKKYGAPKEFDEPPYIPLPIIGPSWPECQSFAALRCFKGTQDLHGDLGATGAPAAVVKQADRNLRKSTAHQ